MRGKAIFVVVCLWICFKVTSLAALPSQVIIITNAETGSDNKLNQTGKQRAAALAPYFNLTSALIQYGTASSIFAAKPVLISLENTVRAIQTAAPTAESLALPVHSPFGAGEEALMADYILYQPRYQGQNVIIVWQHEYVPDLIEAFGYIAPVDPIPADRFDYTFVLPFPQTSSTATALTQHLMAGDP